MILGRLYGPADLFFQSEPWSRVAAEHGITGARNPILSDLAFANLPWRAAVREAFANGRLPFWNRFVLGGSPLLSASQSGIFHPSTWLGLWLPLPLSWTFSCTFTLFLALLSAFLFFRDFGLDATPAMIGAIGWGFSTYVVFWNGWSIGPSTATFPLLLLGLRRLARGSGSSGVALTAAALWLSASGGHPESLLHAAAAGGVYFLWELAGIRRARVTSRMGAALGAGALALLLAGPFLFPLIEAIPHSAEFQTRRAASQKSAGTQSVHLDEAVRRALPDLLPFAHGIYGRSPVQAGRNDGSGMPLGYGGALLFPLVLIALGGRVPRGRVLFGAFLVAGLGYGASAPGLLDLTQRLPGFALALNYRLVFLASIGLAGLAAFGAQALGEGGAGVRLAKASGFCAAALFAGFLLSRPVFAARGLPPRFVWTGLALEIAPLLLLVFAGIPSGPTGRRLAGIALVLLVAQRGLELGGIYPTVPASALAPRLPTLESLARGAEPARIVAADSIFRPNAAALYALEDVRGYESVVLDRFADTYPLWCHPQFASFNRVDGLDRPFLCFLNARFGVAAPADRPPPGWTERARGPDLEILENHCALPRAFVPRALRHQPDPVLRLAEMARAIDFSEVAWLSRPGAAQEKNGTGDLSLRSLGPDLIVSARMTSRALIATSLPDWPGWRAEEGALALPLETVNHAFVGVWLEPGVHSVRLTYRPPGWTQGVAAALCAVGIAAALALARRSRNRTPRGSASGAPPPS